MLENYNVRVYDIELYKNCWMTTLYNPTDDTYTTYTWFNSDDYPDTNTNDIDELYSFLQTTDNLLLVSYNGLNYDDIVIKYFEENKCSLYELWKFSQSLIGSGGFNSHSFKYKYDTSLFDTLDLFELIRKGYNIKSLKSIGVSLKHERLQELPIEYDLLIEPSQLEVLADYNRNDIAITYKLMLQCSGEIELREFLSNRYKMNLLTYGDTKIAKTIFQHSYIPELAKLDRYAGMSPNNIYREIKDLRTKRDDIYLTDIIFDDHVFETPELNNFLSELSSIVMEHEVKHGEPVFSYKKWNLKLNYAGVIYTIAAGGIHSEDGAGMYKSTDKYILVDLDVASQYPSLIVNKQICPAHLSSDIFIEIFQQIITDRLYYKSRKKESEEFNLLQQTLKIVINSVYGLLNSEYFWFCDSVAAFKVTINNQLYLLRLIELCTLNNFQVISANTDGILLYIEENRLDELRQLYHQWEEKYQFTLEETFYDKYIRKDVNNYIAKYRGLEEYKLKGVFTTDIQLLKGYRYPIVSKAILNYFDKGVPVIDTLKSCTDILDFCVSEKVGKQWRVFLQTVIQQTSWLNKYGRKLKHPQVTHRILQEIQLQKINRWYVTKPFVVVDEKVDLHSELGSRLVKYKEDKLSNFAGFADVFIQLLNDLVVLNDFSDYRIDYDYYEDLAYEIIRPIEENDCSVY